MAFPISRGYRSLPPSPRTSALRDGSAWLACQSGSNLYSKGAMTRFAACAFLAVLAVIPSLALARSLYVHPYGSRDAPSNADGFYFSIRSVFKPEETDKCADIDDNGNVVMKDCDETSDNQLWYLEGTAIKHFSTGQCMEVCVTNCKYVLMNRRRVWIKDCTGSDAQQFVSIDGRRIKSVQNENCLDLCNSMTCSPRGDLITFPCQDSTNQQWFMVPGTPQPPLMQVRELVDLPFWMGNE